MHLDTRILIKLLIFTLAIRRSGKKNAAEFLGLTVSIEYPAELIIRDRHDRTARKNKSEIEFLS